MNNNQYKYADKIVGKYRSDDDIYHDLMQFRVIEILLISTHYDAFILQQEGRLTEVIFDDYTTLNLSSAPRITSVSTAEDARKQLTKKYFDLVIMMMRIPDMTPFELSRNIKSDHPDLSVILLLKDNAEIPLLSNFNDYQQYIDNVFVWNSDSKIFFAIVKYVEDQINVKHDTKIGLVRVILLVEDSIRYYSRYLPILYIEIIKQTQRLISKESPFEKRKVLQMRARPKVVLAQNYDDALELIDKYQDFLLCIISDVKYKKSGQMDDKAGVKLIRKIRKKMHSMPAVLQSSNQENKKDAQSLQAHFIYKNSKSLAQDLVHFFINNLGFGDFVFKNAAGEEIDRVESMDELRTKLLSVPCESLKYHGLRDHFSAWLMARGEIQIAKKLKPIQISEFKSLEDLREFLINIFQRVKYQAIRGKVVEFDESNLMAANNIVRLCGGSLGGKGRGIAFMRHLIEEGILPKTVDGVPIHIPHTSVIGTEEFDRFLVKYTHPSSFDEETDYLKVKQKFVQGTLSPELSEKLKIYLKHVTCPLAVRSSSLLEDSLSQPFSGVYSTYLLPNNHPDVIVRLNQLETAIKLIYSSIFSQSARSYFDAINYKIDEEKMAIVIQEVVGVNLNDTFYPHFSGVAQSYNYYPVSYMKPDDGIAMIAVGLGKYVVEGEKTFRFCPVYPKLDILTPEDYLQSSQRHLYGIDMKSKSFDLIKGEDTTLVTLNMQQAEDHEMLNHIASVWDAENDRILPGLECPGARIIKFEYILKFNTFPLAKIIKNTIEILRKQLGTPVEIEFAVTMKKGAKSMPSFHLLQIKHFIRNISSVEIDTNHIDPKSLFVYTTKGMGNGRIEHITDIIFVDPETFERSQMQSMTKELEHLNQKQKKADKQYILIGPGRWGTRDRWLGIPIAWAQISNAKIIIEAGLEDFRVDSSMGSHFFHNITSMNVGYFSVPFGRENCFIDWDWLRSKPIHCKTDHCVHIRLEQPLQILMDGRKGISLIYKKSE